MFMRKSAALLLPNTCKPNKGRTMEEKTELNDIILNHGNQGNGSKKILLAVASLAIILIIIVVIMNSIQSDSTQNLPQPALPKEPHIITKQIIDEDPLFEPVEVIEEIDNNDNLNAIAKKLKEESLKEKSAAVITEEVVVIEEPKPKPEPVAVKVIEKPKAKPVVQKKTPVTKPKASFNKNVAHGKHYVQVGSFSKYAPNKTFLNKITNSGYSYTYHKVVINGKTLNKVIIGPFNTKAEAKKALSTIRKRVEKGAFILKV